MDQDAIRLFDEDRQRFLSCFREFLENPDIPVAIKREAVSTTQVVLGQLAHLLGSNRKIG